MVIPPAQRRQMGKISGHGMMPLFSKVIDSPLQISRVPQNNGGDEQIQTARAMAVMGSAHETEKIVR
ncbi:hypothetical protein C8R21_1439 [Nitrosospira multiformis]|uniref:Uncharacterized protein n=1 Tax=Nitrosospira multiformis TaxID=1231 RepID=A0A2T5I325_9PROT|nr:hypothetical protein C8R21_1439 [Nitrosospira multiformis]